MTPTERETEAALAGLRPTPPAGGGRDALLRMSFRAGWEAAEADVDRRGRRQLFTWRAAAAVLAIGLGVALLARPTSVERVVIQYQTRDRNGTATDPLVLGTPAVDGQAATPVQTALWADAGPAGSPGRPVVPSADSDYLVVRDAVLRLGVPVLPPAGGGQGAVAVRAGPSADGLLGGTPRPAASGGGVDLSKIRDFLKPGDRL